MSPSQSPLPNHMTPDQFRALGHQAIELIARYWETVEEHPVQSQVQPGQIAAMLPDSAPTSGEDWQTILADIHRVVVPGLTHWQSPNFFAYFPCSGSFPAIIGDLLSTGLGIQGMLWSTSPACTELETRVVDWLGEMIGLPSWFLSTSGSGGGVIQSTASEATLVALLAARAKARARGVSDERMTYYASTQAHSSFIKAAMIAGVVKDPADRTQLRLISTDADYAMDSAALAHAIADDLARNLIPVFLCASVGTTSTTAVDPLSTLGPIASTHNIWLHVDAAYAGAACICPEHRWMLDGIHHAQSFCMNPHKWLLTSFDCDCLWTSDRNALVAALSITPDYLKNAASSTGQVIDYRDWQIPLGRRFRALKLWLVIRHYGVAGLQAFIREHIRLAQLFETLVRTDDRFEIPTPRTTGLIAFRLKPLSKESPADGDSRNKRLLEAINATGKAYLSHTVLTPSPACDHPRYILRLALGATLVEERHVQSVWKLIASLA